MRRLKIIFQTLKRWWMAFAHALGWLNTRVVLTILYFTVLAIPALVLKVIRKDLLKRRFAPQQSYWIEKEPVQHTVDHARHQF